jgi:hypothetical protein
MPCSKSSEECGSREVAPVLPSGYDAVSERFSDGSSPTQEYPMEEQRQNPNRFLLAVLLMAISVPSACGDGNDDEHANHSQTTCGDKADLDTYVDGLSRTSNAGHYTVTLLTMDPAPPTRGIVSLKLGITDANGDAVEDATVSFEPVMPQHGHGSDPEKNPGTWNDGGYDVGPLTLQMPGYWEFQVKVSGSDDDTAVFRFCVDG